MATLLSGIKVSRGVHGDKADAIAAADIENLEELGMERWLAARQIYEVEPLVHRKDMIQGPGNGIRALVIFQVLSVVRKTYVAVQVAVVRYRKDSQTHLANMAGA
jgi:hypothetical protein